MNYIIKGLKIIMKNIINYQVLTKISTIKFKPKNTKLEDDVYDGWFRQEELNDEKKIDHMHSMEKKQKIMEKKQKKEKNRKY